jgi:hypothetical protein
MPFTNDQSENERGSKFQVPDSESQATAGPTFRPFNPEGTFRVYIRNLPHWRQPGATYFVTFRQDDSVPTKVLAEWLDIRERWYRAHQLGSIKKWASRQIGSWLSTQPQEVQPSGPAHNKPRFWQHESYDRIVRDPEELAAFRRYIARNPKAAKAKGEETTTCVAAWLDAFAPRDDLLET